MGKKSASAPAAPDPVATAAAQTATNKETAIANARLNNVDQYTPYGSLTYKESEGVDGTPKFTSNIQLSPEQQQLLDYGNQGDIGTAKLGLDQLGRISNAVSSPYSYAGLGDAPSADDIATAQQKGQDAVLSRLQPQFERDQNSLDTKLSNMGVQYGSEAWKNAQDEIGRNQNDARQQAVLTGQDYASQGQSDALNRRQQGITEYSAQRNAPLNEYSALTSGSQVQNPSFNTPSYNGAQPADVAGNIYKNYQASVGQANANTASRNSATSSLFGLGGSLGAAAIMSDSRLKFNIKKIGKLKNNLNVYSYTYKGDDVAQIGVMAQEVMKKIPSAVIMMPSGYYAVDYGQVLHG